MKKTAEDLRTEEKDFACKLLKDLILSSKYEGYTLVDPMQMARLEYNLAEMLSEMGGDGIAVNHYRKAFCLLMQGGFDMSMKKWAELTSLRTKE